MLIANFISLQNLNNNLFIHYLLINFVQKNFFQVLKTNNYTTTDLFNLFMSSFVLEIRQYSRRKNKTCYKIFITSFKKDSDILALNIKGHWFSNEELWKIFL